MATTTKVQCWKCNGSGKLHAFLHRDNGKCYECNGDGFKMVSASDVARNELDRAIEDLYIVMSQHELQYVDSRLSVVLEKARKVPRETVKSLMACSFNKRELANLRARARRQAA